MKHPTFLAAFCAFALAAGAGAAPQEQQPQQQPQQERERQGQQQAEPMQREQGPYILSDDLIGTDIESAQGETITQVEQLIIERDTGQVKYVIADFGGFLGIGAREVAVPWSELQMTGPDTLVFDRTADQLRNAPEFDEQEFLGMENLAGWEREVESFFTGEPAREEPGQVRTEQGTQQAGPLTRSLILSDNLIGTNLENAQDETVGSVEQLIIQRKSGKVSYAVVDVGGFLGIGAREVAMPWDSLNFTGPEEIVLERSGDLENAPEFDEQEFRGLSNFDEWESEIAQFFGAETEEAQRAERRTEETEREQQAEGERQDLYDRGKRETVSGRVVGVEEEAELGSMQPGVQLRVRTEDDEEMLVYLAPQSYIDQIGLSLKSDQEVQIRGARVEVNGREALIADQITIRLRDEEGKPLWRVRRVTERR